MSDWRETHGLPVLTK